MNNDIYCPRCKSGAQKYYDCVKRKVKTKAGESNYILVPRYRCSECNYIFRILPENVLPFKQYEAEIIFGVIDGIITPETLGFEDYPCEGTVKKWMKQFSDNNNIPPPLKRPPSL